MNFKNQVEIFLEAYNLKNEQLLEESIRNNSASNRLQSIINKAEKKMRTVSDREADDIKKALSTIESARDEFLRLENSYKGASSKEKKNIKSDYDKLRNKYSYKLKRFHFPKGAAAAIIGAALAAAGATGAYKYNQNHEEMLATAKKQYEESPYMKMLAKNAQEKEERWNNKVNKMEENNKSFRRKNTQMSLPPSKEAVDKHIFSLEAKNKAFRNTEKKSDETVYRNNIEGHAKKLYKDGIINPDNRKSLNSYDFIDFKNALMSAYNVDGYMTEENGKEFAKEYLKILENKAPLSHKIVMDLARRYMATPYRQQYEKTMKKSGRY